MGIINKMANLWETGGTSPVPKEKTKKDHRIELVPNETNDPTEKIEIEIEGESVRVGYSAKDGITISRGEKKISLKRGSYDINILGHLLAVEYKESTNFILSWGFGDEGLCVSLDGKPVTGSANHPMKRVEKASYGLFALAATQVWGLISAIFVEDQHTAAIALSGFLTIVILSVLGFTAKKIPRLSTGLGFIIGASITISYIAESIASHVQTGFSPFNVWPLLFWTSLMGGATLAIFRGFIAAVMEKRRNTFISLAVIGVVLMLSAVFPVVVLLGLYVQESTQNASWQDFRSEEFGFQAQFPSSPTHVTQPIGDVTMNMFTSERWDGTSYAIIFYKEPERKKLPKKADAIQQMEESLNALATGNEGGRLVSHDILTFSGYPSANFTASFIGPLGRAGSMRGRMILVEDGFYVVMVVGSSSQESFAERFIDSFKFLP